MEKTLTAFNIWFLLLASMLGSGLFIVGMICGGLNWLGHTTIPDSTLVLFLGLIVFSLFFPWFLCFYCCRFLLRAIRDLEERVKNLGVDV